MPRGTGRGRGPEVGRDLEGRSRLIWVSTVPSATAVVSSLGEASAWGPVSCVPGASILCPWRGGRAGSNWGRGGVGGLVMELGRGDLTGVRWKCSGLGNSVDVREAHSPGLHRFGSTPGVLSLMPHGGGSVGGASSEKKEFSSCSGASGRAVGESCRGSGIVGLSVSSALSQENLPPSLFKPLARSIALWLLHRFVFLCCVLARAVRNSWRFLMWLHIWGPTLTYQGFYELV